MKDILKKVVNKETIAYLVFGIIATILNILLFHLFVNLLQMPTALGNFVDTIICVLFQYFTNRIWIFKSKNKGIAAVKEFIQFIAARAITAGIDELIMVVGVDIIAPRILEDTLQETAGVVIKIISNMIVVALNYIFSKLIVFRKK